MPVSTQSVDENIKIQFLQLQSINNQLAVVKEFKKSVETDFKTVEKNIGNFGKSISKTFSLSSLGNKIGDTFNKGFKSLTKPFESLGSKIGGVFSGVRSKLASFNPLGAIKDKVKNVVKKPVTAIKTLLGKNDEQLKAKFYRTWYNPKKVAKIWAKEFSKNGGSGSLSFKKYADSSIEMGGSGLGGIFKTITKVLNRIATGISIIAASVAFFFDGPGAGIAIAIGITPLVLLIGFMFFKLFNKLEPLIDKIVNTAIPVIEKLGEKIIEFIDNPGPFIAKLVTGFINGLFDALEVIITRIKELLFKPFEMIGNTISSAIGSVKGVVSGVIESGKNVVSGVKNFVSSGFNKLIGRSEAPTVNMQNVDTNIFESMNTNLTDIKKTLESGLIYNKLITKLENMKIMKKLGIVSDKLHELMTELADAFQNFKNKIKEILPKIGNFIGDGLKNALGGIKSFFGKFFGGSENAQTEKTNTNIVTATGTNPFDEFIKGFEQMKKDTISLLKDIKEAVINIEKNKIKIGDTFAVNSGETSDGKKINNLQNVTLNYQVDIDKVLEKMDETNKRLDGILTNTSIKETSERKTESIWSV